MKCFVFYKDHEFHWVFFRGVNVNEYNPWRHFPEIPTKSIIYLDSGIKQEVKWFKADFTPILIADVPKELIVMVLLLT